MFFTFILKLPIPVIEHLPQELRDRFTEMREMDLSVQSEYKQKDIVNNYFYTLN